MKKSLDLTIDGIECVATSTISRVVLKVRRPTTLVRPSPGSVLRDAVGRDLGVWAPEGNYGEDFVEYVLVNLESFMDRLQSTYKETSPMSTFLGHNVTHQDVKYDVAKNQLNVRLTVDGDLGKELPQYINGMKQAPDDFRGLTPKSVAFVNGQTEIILAGEYQKFMEAGGTAELPATKTDAVLMYGDHDWTDNNTAIAERIRSAYGLDTERNEVNDTIEALERDIKKTKKAIMTKDSTLTSTSSNAKLAAQIAASNVALDKMVTLLQQQLANMGVDTSFISQPAGRSLVKMALPTMIMTVLDLPPVQESMPKNARTAVRGVADSAQLAAMTDGMQTLIQLFMPLLAEFAQIKGSLIESSGLSMDELFPEDVPVEDPA